MRAAGRRQHEILFEQLTTSGTDGYGSPITSWVPQAKPVWASIDPPSLAAMRGGGEKILAGSDTAVDLVQVTLYPNPGLAPETWRFRYDGRVYDIKTARLNNGGDELSLLALVGASDGL
jgi:SPP1 family predicted phage head-tail adaptor